MVAQKIQVNLILFLTDISLYGIALLLENDNIRFKNNLLMKLKTRTISRPQWRISGNGKKCGTDIYDIILIWYMSTACQRKKYILLILIQLVVRNQDLLSRHYFPLWLWNRLKSGGLEPNLSHTEKNIYSIKLQTISHEY